MSHKPQPILYPSTTKQRVSDNAKKTWLRWKTHSESLFFYFAFQESHPVNSHPHFPEQRLEIEPIHDPNQPLTLSCWGGGGWVGQNESVHWPQYKNKYTKILNKINNAGKIKQITSCFTCLMKEALRPRTYEPATF